MTSPIKQPLDHHVLITVNLTNQSEVKQKRAKVETKGTERRFKVEKTGVNLQTGFNERGVEPVERHRGREERERELTCNQASI